MPDNRLDPDINLLGYWGFDEALETDNALDGATFFSPADLVPTSALAVQAGRVGAARDFSGTASYAAVTSSRLRLLGDATFIGWCKLDSYNSGGSLLRTVLSCGGPTTGDNLLYAVQVDSSGRLVYKHNSASGVVIARSGVSVIRTGQFYCIMVRRVANGLNQDIEFFVDNVAVPVVDVTVNAVPSALPVPPPSANAAAIFSAARSQKETDVAYWDGLLDELSVHDVARPYQPYLRGTYYRVAVRNATSRLTAPNNVLGVSSADMGAGVRWWCYERDRDLYVVRESPLGVFGPDTRLTTTGSGFSTSAQNAELVYDAATDTLLVFFVAGNRIFKLSAGSTDDPAGVNMPFTADSYPAIKSLDNADGGAFGLGGGQRQINPLEVTYVNRSPVKVFGTDTPAYDIALGGGQHNTVNGNRGISVPSINFMEQPSGFGVVVGPYNSGRGHRIYRLIGGGSVFLGTATWVPTASFYFFVLVPPPIFGDVFYAEAIAPNGGPSGVFSAAIAYRNFEPTLVGSIYYVGREGDGTQTMNTGMGGGQLANYAPTYVNRTPVKLVAEDSPAYNVGQGGGNHGKINTSGANRPGALAIERDLR